MRPAEGLCGARRGWLIVEHAKARRAAPGHAGKPAIRLGAKHRERVRRQIVYGFTLRGEDVFGE